MNNHIIPPMMFLTTIMATLCFSLLTTLPQSHSQQLHDNNYTDCAQPFNCGPAVSDIGYPFWGDNRPDYCGGGRDFKLHCGDGENGGGQHASIQIGSQDFTVLHINNTNYTVRMPRELPTTDVCSATFKEIDNNITLSHSPFRYTNPEALHNITIFYACPSDAPLGDNNYTCAKDEYPPIAFYDYEDVNDTTLYPGLRDCKGSITVPVPKSVRLDPNGGNIDALNGALRAGFEFEVNYTVRFANECRACMKSGGACGTNDTATFQDFTCHCPDGSDRASDCPVSDIGYPFWGDNRPDYCGGGRDFKLHCGDGENGGGQHASIQIGSQDFTVLHINNTNYTVRMPRELPTTDVCSATFKEIDNNITLSHSPFRYTNPEALHNITIFYACPSDAPLGDNNYTCAKDEYPPIAFYDYEDVNDTTLYPGLRDCHGNITVPVPKSVRLEPNGGNIDALNGALRAGFEFEVNYTVRFANECIGCMKSGGACGTNDTATFQDFTCHCPDGSDRASDCPGDHETWHKKVVIGTTAAAVIAGLLTICCFMCKLSGWQENSWLPTKSNRDIEAFLKNHGALTLKRYKFSHVKKMTNSFKVKLGQGGFGVVYKGKLPNGSNVAVKILNPSKGNGQEFINEVASISRTSHVNVVTLLGFCIAGCKKVLIYEFMPNGSLDKLIYKKGHENTSSLSWDNLFQIAIGTARGLEYLHRGCNTRILHFDIKPHNILLDENFCPKISDFGLAKLCPKKESIISMSDARGTLGYVAPEVWSRQFGGVSHKSDVYSYGMMLLEIVGGRKNIYAEASHTSEIYFPDWIYKRLEQGTDLGLDGELAIEENEVIKRMAMVGLWCIQIIPNDRPTMSRVVEMLEGSMNSPEMPPKPILSSSVVESSTAVN